MTSEVYIKQFSNIQLTDKFEGILKLINHWLHKQHKVQSKLKWKYQDAGQQHDKSTTLNSKRIQSNRERNEQKHDT